MPRVGRGSKAGWKSLARWWTVWEVPACPHVRLIKRFLEANVFCFGLAETKMVTGISTPFPFMPDFSLGSSGLFPSFPTWGKAQLNRMGVGRGRLRWAKRSQVHHPWASVLINFVIHERARRKDGGGALNANPNSSRQKASILLKHSDWTTFWKYFLKLRR